MGALVNGACFLFSQVENITQSVPNLILFSKKHKIKKIDPRTEIRLRVRTPMWRAASTIDFRRRPFDSVDELLPRLFELKMKRYQIWIRKRRVISKSE